MRTIRERMALLESNHERLNKLIKDYDGMEGIYMSMINEQVKTNDNLKLLAEKVDKMYPIVKDIMFVKGYGTFTWKALKWTGGILFTLITSWHFFKEHIKTLFHYIFN